MLFLRLIILNLIQNETIFVDLKMNNIDHSLSQMNKKVLCHTGDPFFLILIAEGHLFT